MLSRRVAAAKKDLSKSSKIHKSDSRQVTTCNIGNDSKKRSFSSRVWSESSGGSRNHQRSSDGVMYDFVLVHFFTLLYFFSQLDHTLNYQLECLMECLLSSQARSLADFNITGASAGNR